MCVCLQYLRKRLSCKDRIPEPIYMQLLKELNLSVEGATIISRDRRILNVYTCIKYMVLTYIYIYIYISTYYIYVCVVCMGIYIYIKCFKLCLEN